MKLLTTPCPFCIIGETSSYSMTYFQWTYQLHVPTTLTTYLCVEKYFLIWNFVLRWIWIFFFWYSLVSEFTCFIFTWLSTFYLLWQFTFWTYVCFSSLRLIQYNLFILILVYINLYYLTFMPVVIFPSNFTVICFEPIYDINTETSFLYFLS